MKFRYLSILLIFFLLCPLSPLLANIDSSLTISAFSNSDSDQRKSFPTDDLILKYDFLSYFPFLSELKKTEREYVYPSGQSCGIKLMTNGILVLSASGSASLDGSIVAPGKDAGINPGDYILAFNGTKLKNTAHLEKLISENRSNPAELEISRQNKVFSTTIYPETSDNINYVLGLWVRDSAAGMGTLTYITEDKGEFAALGHSISDADTGEQMTLKKGALLSASVISVKKGYAGIPGELIGVFDKPEISLGEIILNTEYGVYGKLSREEEVPETEPVPVANINEVSIGPAQIISTVDGSNPEYFDINITKISKKDSDSGKNLIIEVTDKKLLELTGGIVQGMSGSPILQNGKIVGAVTHVFVNDPTRGYGIFIENMLTEAEKIK